MSDVSPAGRVPDPRYLADVPAAPVTPADPVTPAYPSNSETGATDANSGSTDANSGSAVSNSGSAAHSGAWRDPGDDGSSPAQQVAGQAKEAAGQATTDVKDTAKEQAQRVGSEARTQARNVASEVRGKVGEQARTQNDKLVGSIRRTADHLDEMRGERADSPAAAVVSRIADGGRQFAEYLDRNGPEGVLREVQDFARRRPGAFLATALAAGFVVGRLGKSVAKADPDAGVDKPSGDSFVSGTGYPGTGYQAAYVEPVTYPAPTGSTEYAATGTGTPLVVEEDYVYDTPERRP
ncbi:hypothetical protein ACWKSP_04745 [Micromonosporaceae bacterium Da 78-11]